MEILMNLTYWIITNGIIIYGKTNDDKICLKKNPFFL